MAPISVNLIDPGSKPVHARPYTVPRLVEQQLPKETARLVDIGVLDEWAFPTFAIAKKNATIRVVSDFRKLNSLSSIPNTKNRRYNQIRGRIYPCHGSGFTMGYYHINLDAHVQKLCTIIFPWGKYVYKRLPMGIKIAPDIFRNVMSKLTQDSEYAKTYLDNLFILTNSNFADHLTSIEIYSEHLRLYGTISDF